MKRLFITLLIPLLNHAATWSAWNGITVGATGGNISQWNGGTIGTSAGNIGAWNGLASPGGGTVATPTDSPGAGTYSSTQSVTLSDATGSAVICYRTDGTAPTAATPGTCDSPAITYSGAFNISATSTLKAIGTKVGMTNSGVMSSLYTINIASCGSGTIAAAQGSTTSGLDFTISLTIAAGDAVAVFAGGPTSTPTAVTDNGTGGANTYTQVANSPQTNGGYGEGSTFYTVAVHAATTITVTAAAGHNFAIAINGGGGCSYDTTAYATNTAGATATTASFNTAAASGKGFIAVGGSSYYGTSAAASSVAGTTATIPTNGTFFEGLGGSNGAVEYVTGRGTTTGSTAALTINSANSFYGTIFSVVFK